MSGEAWRDLFDDRVVDATIDLFLAEDPAVFIARANEIIGLLEKFVSDHDEQRPDVPFVRFEEPGKLHRCLSALRTARTHPELARFKHRPVRAEGFARLQKLCAADPIKQQGALLLIKRFEKFQAEAWPYLNPMQLPDRRRNRQQLAGARGNQRSRQLPRDKAVVRGEYEQLRKQGQAREARAILAKKYGTTYQAIYTATKPQ